MVLSRTLTALFVCGITLRAATFGTAVALVGGASDLVLDQSRNRLYLVNTTQSRVEVYSLAQKQFLTPIPTDSTPLAAAISRSGKYLYVTSYGASSLNIIDLTSQSVTDRISLSAKPEGVAVGSDERVLISTVGTGTGNLTNVLLLYDPSAARSTSVTSISVTPAPPTPPTLPPPSGRPFLSVHGQLVASRDGSRIMGVNLPTTANTRAVFVYETVSATVLRSRTVTSATSVLSVSADGSKFMAGLNLFDTSTLAITAQQNLANSPYPFSPTTSFNTQSNQGGSVFAPDGSVLYSAFDISPVQTPAARANVSQLMISDPDNLLISMGLQLPENLAGKMIISSDGANIYALSESGFMNIPIGTISQSPLAVPDTTIVSLVTDQCGVTAGQQTARVTFRNAGRGNLTATAQLLQYTQDATAAANAPTVRSQQTSAGSAFDFTFSSAAARSLGTVAPHDFLVQSSQAVNIPAQVRVFQNYRNAEARGTLIPIQVSISTSEALIDLAYDAASQRVYISNSGMNRVEVFDASQNKLLTPIKVGQLPHSLGLSPDGGTLYVANTGGESISIVDTVKMQVIGRVQFPPIPINSTLALITPSTIVAHQGGAMFITSTGQLWDVTGGQAVPRGVSSLIGADTSGRPLTLSTPVTMAATPAGERVIVLAANGNVYLYDALSDDFIQTRQIFSGTQTGYYGPVTAGPRGSYYVVNGTILNEALTPTNSGATTTATAAAVATAGTSTYVRFMQTPRTSATALPPDGGSFELVDITSGQARTTVTALEGPLTQVVGTGRANVNGRWLAVDSSGSTAYALSATGLSIIPLTAVATSDRPVVTAKGAVNLASYQTTVAPNTLLSIFGSNFGGTAVAGSVPLPVLLGGVCVTLGSTALPLFAVMPGQINAQIPPELTAGNYQLIVRSVDRKAASQQQSLTVSKYAPAVLVDPQSQQIMLFHSDGKPVTKNNKASRDEPLVMYALGLGATTGGKVTSGAASPSSPLAETGTVEVYFGDPTWKQAAIIVDWSGLAPGWVGLYQLNLRVPGFHISGDSLPVLLKVGNVSSPTSGPLVPHVDVE